MKVWHWQGVPPRAKEHYVHPDNGAIFNFTHAYTELFSPWSVHFSGPGVSSGTYASTYIVYYWIQLSEYQWMVAHSFGHHFDFLHHLLNYPATSAGAWRAVREACPTFSTLIQRAERPLNFDVSLLQTNDPDTKRPDLASWCLLWERRDN